MSDAPSISLRLLGSEDHDAWLPLWQGYQAFYKVAIPAEVTELTWSRLLDAAEPMAGTLAWRGGKAVGLVHFIQHRSTWTAGNYCYLQDLFVSSSQRGGGVGRQLIEHVYEAAAKAGCARVYWLTHESNTGAMALYDKIADRPGFVQYRKALPV